MIPLSALFIPNRSFLDRRLDQASTLGQDFLLILTFIQSKYNHLFPQFIGFGPTTYQKENILHGRRTRDLHKNL